MTLIFISYCQKTYILKQHVKKFDIGFCTRQKPRSLKQQICIDELFVEIKQDYTSLDSYNIRFYQENII